VERYICIHGHFYQPPRENPWLEAIELQDSAYPYHDWNARITAECYAPNGVSRILDSENQIVRLVNNYAKISFNFGPTLLGWLAGNAPDVYRAIVDADRQSRQQFSGHGSALAQPYNHMILPLATRRDRVTQVHWGIRDFEHHFGRKPEGMWLPETAVDLETLDILADSGIRFTILAPHQAARVRPIDGNSWQAITAADIDPTQPYEQRLPSGRSIALFFYNAPISRAVAFEGLLSRGESFAERLISGFAGHRAGPQLVHIATDGESYGHHHRFGDMALAYALHYIESNGLARLTNYGEFLQNNPPTQQVEIVESSSWSCAHGIGRWWSDCGCHLGGHPGWNQAWRTPLRNALDGLRDSISGPFEEKARAYLSDPWLSRNDYIDVIQDRSPDSLRRFFGAHAGRELAEAEQTVALKLLELQRHAMLMYTSCGWFFDDVSGIETVQVIQLAARAAHLAEELFGGPFEAELLDRLAHAKSNIAEHRDGRRIYETYVRPAIVDWQRVAAHYAVSSLFESYAERSRIYCFLAERKDYDLYAAGLARIAVGRVKLISEVTRDGAELSFAAVHLGDHNVFGGVRESMNEATYGVLKQDVLEPFMRADFTQVIRIMDRSFGDSNYSVRSLFRDEQRRVLDTILATSLREAESLYRQIYEHRAPMMRFLTSLKIPLPSAFNAAAEFVLNRTLGEALQKPEIDSARIRGLLETARFEGIRLDTATLEFVYRQNLERLVERMSAEPTETSLRLLDRAVDLLSYLPFSVNIWTVQNGYFRILNDGYAKLREREARGDKAAQAWLDAFRSLGRKLAVKVG
jgi:alpha-amylase/alpha-mannosidase (GH57 family)